MKRILVSAVLALCATAVSADMLDRFEAAENTIQVRAAELYGNPGTAIPWTAQDRVGKDCLLNGMNAAPGGEKTERYVAHLERVAAQAAAYATVDALNADWMSATTANGIGLDDVFELAMTCNTSY